MDFDEFCKQCQNMLDYIVHYFESISHRSVNTNVCPGYLKDLLPENPPTEGEPFDKIMEDVEKCILPGLSHWQHPGFHAYFPTISSYPSILGAILGETIGCSRFNFNISPALKDLEAIVLDWYGKMIGLPGSFLRYSGEGKGGGLLQGTVSECVLICMIAARQNFIKRMSESRFSLSKPIMVASLVVYCSKEHHPCIQKSAVLNMIEVRVLETDENMRLTGETLTKAVKEDREIGLTPFFVNVNTGTCTGACDSIEEIGPICERYGMWLNVDASYAGNALICPEYQHYFKNIKYASSVTLNPAKWLPVHLDCSIVYAKNLKRVYEYLMVDRTMFGYGPTEEDWSYPSNKAHRIIKFYVILRVYGVEALQKLIRNHIRLAKLFEKFVREDERFEVISCDFGIVCFRLKGTNKVNENLLRAINLSGKLLLNSYDIKGKFALRFVVCAEQANEDDMINAWTVIQELTDGLPETRDNEEFSEEWGQSYDYTFQ